MRLSWSDFKSFVDDRVVPIHERPLDDGNLLLEAFDGPVIRNCKIRSGTADFTDYEDNYQASANPTISDKKGHTIVRNGAFSDTEGMKFRGTGIKGTATKNSVTNHDYELTEDRFLNGVELFLQDQEWSDDVKLQVIDIDNILGYGANTVLDEFGTDWNIATDQERQGPYILPYPALILKDLYIRIKYNSTGTTNDVKLKINLFLHKKA